MAIAGFFGTLYVPLRILVVGDAPATARNILDSGWVYNLSTASNLVAQVLFVFLVVALDRLLSDVDPVQSKLMVALVTAAVPVAFLNTLCLIAAQQLAGGPDYLSAFAASQLSAAILAALNLYDQGVLVVQILWGLWLLPFGILVAKSGFIPKVLGILLQLNCFAYLIISFARLLAFQNLEVLAYVLMPFLVVGEFSIIIWLLTRGVRDHPLPAASAPVRP